MMRAPVSTLAAGLRSRLAALGVVVDDDRLLEGVANAQRERARTLNEMAQNSLFFFCEIEAYDEKAARKNLTRDTAPLLLALQEGFKALGEWNAGSIHEVINSVAQRYGCRPGQSSATAARGHIRRRHLAPDRHHGCPAWHGEHLRPHRACPALVGRRVAVDRIPGLAYRRAPSVGL
jgi:hypothetical protein